jgi:hypothetical protein
LIKNLNVEYKDKNTRNLKTNAAAALSSKPDTLIDQHLSNIPGYSLRSNEERKDEM